MIPTDNGSNYMPRHRAWLLTVALLYTLGIGSATAQRPRASPHESTSGTVNSAELSIAYGRPYMRGRTIMGALVPYGRVWCPGADEATTLTTNRALQMGSITLAPGRYTLWMLPSEGEWQMIVNKQTGQWHTQYDPRQDLGRVTLEKRALDEPVDQLTFEIEKAPSGRGGAIVMRWETTEVRAPFTVQ